MTEATPPPAGDAPDDARLAGLAALKRRLPADARRLLEQGRTAGEVMEQLSQGHLEIMRRAFELCLARRTAAVGAPPLGYCLVCLGSGARREMLLAPDQDHALLYAETSAEGLAAAEAFFAPLAGDLVATLEELGYPRCPGGVMADRPAWRGRPVDWQGRLREWIDRPEPQQLVNSALLFDLAPVAGDATLAAAVSAMLRREVQGQSAFLYRLMCLDLRHRVPLGLFGRFDTARRGPHAGEVSLKLGGTLYLVDCVRIFALDKGVNDVSTLARLRALVTAHVFAAETADELRTAFETLFALRLRRELEGLEAGADPDHYVNPATYEQTTREQLRTAFRAVDRLQESTRRYFARTPF